MVKYIFFIFFVVSGDTYSEKEALLFLKSLDEFKEKGDGALLDASESALWDPDKTVLAFCFNSHPSQCFVVKENKVIDVSMVESGNIGKLGISPREDYDKYKTYPSKLMSRKDGLIQIEFTTHSWKKGQRYAAKEPLIINRLGKSILR